MLITAQNRKQARWLTGIFFFVSGIISATWSSRIPDVQHRLELNDAQWGLVLFALPVGQVLGLPLSSWLVAKYSARFMMVISMVLYAVMLSLLGFSAAVWQLMMVLFFYGLFRNLVNISNNTFALDVQQQYPQSIISTFHGLWSLACFLSAGIGTFMIAKGIIPAWHLALIAAIVVIISFWYKSGRSEDVTTIVEKRPFFIAPDRYLLLLGLITFCSMICEGTMFDWSVNYFKQVIHADKEKVTMGYSAFILTMTFGRLIGDKVVARFGAIAILIANGIIMAVGYAIAVAFPYLLPASAGFLLVGLGDSIIIPQVYALAAKSKKMTAAYAIASVTMIGYAGFLSGPLIVGSISDALGMQWSFALMGLLTLLISFLALRVKRVSLANEAYA